MNHFIIVCKKIMSTLFFYSTSKCLFGYSWIVKNNFDFKPTGKNLDDIGHAGIVEITNL